MALPSFEDNYVKQPLMSLLQPLIYQMQLLVDKVSSPFGGMQPVILIPYL